MKQEIRLKRALGREPQPIKSQAVSTSVYIEHPQSITVRIKYADARGMIVFDLERPEGVVPYVGIKPMPYALKVDGAGCDVFTMHGLVLGDVLRIGRELFEGNADVEILGVVEATKENCEAYSKAFGVNVTPHPILGLPALP